MEERLRRFEQELDRTRNRVHTLESTSRGLVLKVDALIADVGSNGQALRGLTAEIGELVDERRVQSEVKAALKQRDDERDAQREREQTKLRTWSIRAAIVSAIIGGATTLVSFALHLAGII